jgi:nucleoid DNA-binding protein
MVLEISVRADVSRKDAARMLRALAEVIQEVTLSGERVTLRSFGAFYSVVPKKKALFGGRRKPSSRPTIRFKEARPWINTASKSTQRR